MVIITDSTLVRNSAFPFFGGGIANFGTMILTNTTVAANSAADSQVGGGGIANGGQLILTNTTVADNNATSSIAGGLNSSTSENSRAVLVNTILARNSAATGNPDCRGSVTSLGTNLVGDPTGCTITLLPTDLTGDPGLGAFTDNGTPGNGHFPLRRRSPAIDAGNNAFCPPTDQLGRRRVGPCDIGAIRFPERREDEP